MATDVTQRPVYDCLVLSGGGAKGAYGAGVAKAIAAYRKKKKLTNPICYVGASAGALNAYLLATKGPDALIDFWLSATNRSVLGVWIRNPKFQGLRRWAAGLLNPQPFSIYANKALAELIGAHVAMVDLKAPLIIVCADYTQGKLKSFYVSDLIDKFVAKDADEPDHKQRLGHFRRIKTDDKLVHALLASAAIPIFFPPVRISVEHGGSMETSWYVDGGIGNNTPTREAAYFLRFLEKMNLGKTGMVYCVIQDPPHTLQEREQRLGLSDILKRTYEVYHHVHTDAIISAWTRINNEVRERLALVENFTKRIERLSLDEKARAQVVNHLTEELDRLAGPTERLEMPLLEIEPTTELGDSLDFNPERARQNIERGYSDTLKLLRETHEIEEHLRLDKAEHDALQNLPIFSGTAS